MVLHGRRAVVVASATGRTLRRLTYGRNEVRDAAVDGDRLVVLLQRRLAVHSLATGRRIASWPVSAVPPPRLEGASRGLAVYVAGLAIHLVRLEDGREVVVSLPDAAEPAYAAVTPAGLFYSYTNPRRVPAGRVVFVSRADVDRVIAD